MKLTRYENNPIFGPDPESDWASACRCNPAAWFDGEKVLLLYRAGPDTDEHPIFLGLAESRNGLDFQNVSDRPVFSPSPSSFDGGCIEDPRMVKFGDTFFITYATRMFTPAAYWKKTLPLDAWVPELPDETPIAIRDNLTRSGLAMTKDFKAWYRLGPITSAAGDNRDAIIFPEKIHGQFFMLHRPVDWVGPEYGCEKPSIWISASHDMLCWKQDALLAQPLYEWEQQKIGGNAPPIKTDQGWLMLYHGVDNNNVYRVGAMLLDADDPRKIIGRTPEPILEPEMPYEKEGLVPNVVFPCGNVVMDGQLLVYYGGADTCCAVASAPLDDLVDYLLDT